ncbi:MAG: mucoidy inhibitor MuiA family protein [Spirochaetes bacterium]|nr:mucoidy inhibitor MuiA family protein [Spirochaetota bacterium]
MTTLKSKINHVTVFTDRAQAVRTAKQKLTKGEHVLVFDDLPQNIEPNSIQVSGKGDTLLKDVKFQTKHLAHVPEADVKALYDKRQSLYDSLTQINDRILHAQNEKKFVENITGRLTHATEKSAPIELNPEKWVKMVEFYRSKQDGLDQEIRQAEKEKRSFQDELNKVDRQINEYGPQTGKSKNQVEVILEAKKEGEAHLDLSYIVYGPSWYPVYDLRVSTENKKMSVTYNAMIRQNTGEDWKDVKLLISTAQPNISGQQPELSPWYLDIYYPANAYGSEVAAEAQAPAMSKKSVMRAKQMFQDKERDEMEELDVIEDKKMEVAATKVETKATSVVFAISGDNTINSDNQPHKVTVMMNDLPAEFRYSAVPKLAPYAYLKARVKNETDYPFLAGETNVFLDSNFVANARLELVAPSEEFWTFLGVDEGMKVEHKFLKKYEKGEGVFGKKKKLIYEYLTEITNNKRSEEELVVWDQLPISNNQDIEVELLEPEYKKDSPALKMNEYKYLEWYFKVKSKQKIKIPFKFSVAYPRDKIVNGL